jgi:hypothetical protein
MGWLGKYSGPPSACIPAPVVLKNENESMQKIVNKPVVIHRSARIKIMLWDEGQPMKNHFSLLKNTAAASAAGLPTELAIQDASRVAPD